MKGVLQPLTGIVLILLGLTAASAADAGIHKKIIGSGWPLDLAHCWRPQVHKETTTLIVSTEEMEDIIIIVKSLEDSCLLIEGLTQTVENEKK